VRHLLAAGLAMLLGSAPACISHAATPDLAPSPFPILQPRALTPPLLDIAPVCLPGAGRPEFAAAIALVRTGDMQGARHALKLLAEGPEDDIARDAALSLSILANRRANHVTAARTALEAALDEDAVPASRACVRMELARLSLRAGLLPEAHAELARVGRELEKQALSLALVETAQFYRAEVEVLRGQRSSARDGYQSLTGAIDSRLRRAAQLRLADLALGWPLPEPGAESKAGWRTLRNRLAQAREHGFDITHWSARAAEVAIAAGEFDEAHRWLADAERLEGRAGVASIRKADVLVALGRGADARNVLERVSSTASLRSARELASIRRAGYGLGGESGEQRVERLTRGASSRNPHVAALARYELARVLLTAGDIEGTLEALTRLAYTGALPGAQDGLVSTLDRAVAAAARADVECPALLERLGGRRELFISLSGEAQPFLRLGDCFLEVEMPGQALDVYRQVARRFGAASATSLPLRIARASFAADDLPILRATLRAHFVQQRARVEAATPDAEDAQWRWLRAQLDLRDGNAAIAGVALDSLAREPKLAPETRVAVERALARLDEGTISAARLGFALASSLAHSAPGIAASARAEAWLRLADLQRDQGREITARAAYRRAAELLPPGARRERADFAAALLAPTASEAHAALSTPREDDAQTPWSVLARAELRLIALRAAARGEVLER
jgi:hypothetical protein